MARMNRRDWRTAMGPGGAALAILSQIAMLGAAASAQAAAGAGPTSFASPQQAADALIGAAQKGSKEDVLKILGQGANKIVSSGDPVADARAKEKFAAEARDSEKVEKQGDDRAILIVGKDDWPLPIPIVRHGGRWMFDAKAGEQEILSRRIGANELDAIEVCRAYVDAQTDYATKDRNNDGFIEYAQKFVSSPGKRDGLYWPSEAGEEQSPIGVLMASARAEGYGKSKEKPEPYHGYYYRILKAQGENAPGGALDYVVKGHMVGGFGLIAFPAQYGVSGIMTFIVNHEGVVYQKDLGPDTAAMAEKMTRYDPDKSWKAQ
jgi:hypothetical protein